MYNLAKCIYLSSQQFTTDEIYTIVIAVNTEIAFFAHISFNWTEMLSEYAQLEK